MAKIQQALLCTKREPAPRNQWCQSQRRSARHLTQFFDDYRSADDPANVGDFTPAKEQAKNAKKEVMMMNDLDILYKANH